MGGNTKLTFKEYVETQVNNTLNTSIVVENKAGTDTTTTNTQFQSISVGDGCCDDYSTDDAKLQCTKIIAAGAGCDGDFDVTAKIGATIKVINTSNQTVTTDLKTELKSLIEQEINAVQTQLNSATLPSIGNNSDQNTDIQVRTTLNNVVDETITESNVATIRQVTFDSQDQRVRICSHITGNCKFNSELFATIFLNNLAVQVINNISDTQVASEAYDVVKTENSQTKTDAIALFIDSVGAFFRSIAGIILIVVLFLFLLIFIILRVFFGGGGDES